jgi:hypothetical protein
MIMTRKVTSLFGLFTFILISFHYSTIAAAKEPQVSVKASLNKAFITIGDPVEYTLTVKHDPSVQVLSSFPSPPQDIFKIKKVEDIKRKEGEMIVEGRKYTLTSFALGEFILDPVKIEYRIGSAPTQAITTDKIFLTVKSVSGKETKTDIRGIKSVIALAKKFLFWIIALILFVLFPIGYFIYRKMQRQELESAQSKIIMTAEEEAMTALNQLFDSDWIRRGKVKEYYLRLSEILRNYFERRYGILAIESTTDEIVRALKAKDIDPELRNKITEVLESADLAKFAKWKPEPPQIILINQRSKQIVDESKPKEVIGGV